MHLIANTIIYPQPTIEVIEDEDSLQLHKAVLEKGSHILKVADGSKDKDNDNMPGLAPIINNNDNDSSDKEATAKSAEAELSKFQINTYQNLS